jgi:RNA polymerase sigma-70 factor (ECF subfamily)
MESAPQRNESLKPDDEDSLVRAAQGGDPSAFTEIVRRYQRSVYRTAYGLTRNASDADDLSQEAFVRAYQALGRFRAGEPLSPWLTRITVNLAFSLFRRRKRRPETSLEPLVEAGRQWAGEDDPAANVEKHEHDRHVNDAFAELSEEHRVALVLRVVDGLSYDEIAKTLNVPIGTVMSRLSRARSDLKQRLKARTGETR